MLSKTKCFFEEITYMNKHDSKCWDHWHISEISAKSISAKVASGCIYSPIKKQLQKLDQENFNEMQKKNPNTQTKQQNKNPQPKVPRLSIDGMDTRSLQCNIFSSVKRRIGQVSKTLAQTSISVMRKLRNIVSVVNEK